MKETTNPGGSFTRADTSLTVNRMGYTGKESVEDSSRDVVRVALPGPDGPRGTFTRWENVTIPW